MATNWDAVNELKGCLRGTWKGLRNRNLMEINRANANCCSWNGLNPAVEPAVDWLASSSAEGDLGGQKAKRESAVCSGSDEGWVASCAASTWAQPVNLGKLVFLFTCHLLDPAWNTVSDFQLYRISVGKLEWVQKRAGKVVRGWSTWCMRRGRENRLWVFFWRRLSKDLIA